jgi:hypothetical protein
MTEPVEIDAEFASLHGVVKFKGSDQTYMVMSSSKALSNAKGLREAAALIGGGERADDVRAWLNDLAGKFERCEPE